jgi:hypothetical protein
MMLGLFVILLIVGLCVCHALGRTVLHRKPGPAANPVRRIVEPRQVAAEENYAKLFEFDEEFTGWKVQRYTDKQYEQKRETEL